MNECDFNTIVEEYEKDIMNLEDLIYFPLIYDIKKNKAARTAYCDKANELYLSKR